MHITAKDIQEQREMMERGRKIAEAQTAQAERLRLRDTFAAAALTGLLAAPTDKDRSMEYWARLAYESADAMLRERSRTNHDAAPAATAQVDAAGISRQGTGDTPATRATQGEGSEQRECTEPVAWAVCTPGDGDWSPCFFHEPHAQRHASAIFGSKNVVPLYRKPTLTDAEREAIDAALGWCDDRDAKTITTLRGLLERPK